MRSDMAYRGLSQHVELDRAADPRDRFNLQELIGEGTYGEVYCAKDKKTGKRVAIKVSNLLTYLCIFIIEFYCLFITVIKKYNV